MFWLKEYKPENHRFGKATISLIQAGLNSLGYSVGTIDGKLNTATMNAIKAYQKDNNLAETGKPGPQWLGVFYHDIVKDVQYKLTQLGFNTKGQDGLMGANTRKAILQYRKTKKLAIDNYPYIDASLVATINGNVIDNNIKIKKTKEAHEKALDYRVGKIDGVTGSKTVNALKSFQKRHKLKATGEFDSKTKEAFKIALLKDSQKKLNALGYKVGRPDGKLGNKTITALRKYRTKQNLTERGGVDSDLLIKLHNSYTIAEDKRKDSEDQKNSSSVVRYAQAGMRTLGYNITVDGVMGKGTQKAIRKFQKRYKLKASGKLDKSTVAKMHTIFLKESQRKLNVLGFKAGTPDGKMGSKTKNALNKFRKKERMSGSGLDSDLIIAIDDMYDGRSISRTASKSSHSKSKTSSKSSKAGRQGEATSTTTSQVQSTIKVTKPAKPEIKYSSVKQSSRKAKGRMAFKRSSGRVTGCSIAGRNISIAWCEPFYPLPKNNYCEATFKPGSNKVINLWCK